MSKLVLTSVKAEKGIDNKPIKDENGYYKIRVGAFNTFNESGIFYTFTDDVKELVSNSSDLMRRIREGYLKGELGHPQMLPGMTMKEYINRLMRIDLTRVCVHFKGIELEETNEEPLPGYGKKVIVWAWLKPYGPYKDTLADALEDNEMNSAFSVRSIAVDTVKDGITIRTMKILVTWDFVVEPGIKGSNKWKSTGIEDRDLAILNLDNENEINDFCNSLSCDGMCGLESDTTLINETIKLIKEETSVKRDIINEW